jgi:hypothetical protein
VNLLSIYFGIALGDMVFVNERSVRFAVDGRVHQTASETD